MSKTNNVTESIQSIYDKGPKYLSTISSSSFMWMANSATVSPSVDHKDNKLHITPSNLALTPHRSLEINQTQFLFSELFNNTDQFRVHLPSPNYFRDEGAANHIRFAPSLESKGLHLMVYSCESEQIEKDVTDSFPGRQTKEASKFIIQQQGVSDSQVVFAKQNSDSVQQGIFHNDVISSGHLDLFITHELAFEDTNLVINDLQSKYYALHKENLNVVVIKESMLSIKECVLTYFFNMQIISPNSNDMELILPMECLGNQRIQTVLTYIQEKEERIKDIHYVQLNESMKNGGGPACLRLRLQLTMPQWTVIPSKFKFNDKLYKDLIEIIQTNYPESFEIENQIETEFIQRLRNTYNLLYQAFGLENSNFLW